MASKAIGFLNFKFGADLKGFDRAMKKAQKNLKKFGKNIQRTGQNLTTGLSLPILGLGAASLKLASDFEETDAKFKTVFSSIQAEAEQTSKVFADSFGLSDLAAKQLLSNTGDLLVGFGFTEKSALDLSQQVNELAVDLASFTNFSGGAEGASAALTKALLGERESMKSLGIAITETDLKKFAADQGLVWKELDRVTKAQLTFDLALKQSSKAVGDFERTQDGFANQVRITKGELTDAAISLGEHLLPMAQKAIAVFRGLIERFNSLSVSTKENIVKWGLIVAAIGPALIIVGKMAMGASSLISLFAALRTAVLFTSGAFKALTVAMVKNPIGAVIALLTTAAAGYFLLGKETKKASRAQKEFNGVTESSEDAIKRLSKSINDMGKDSFQVQIEEIEDLIKKIKGFEIKPSQFTKGVALSDKQKKEIQDLNMLLFKLKQKQADAKKEADDLNKSVNNLGPTANQTAGEVKKLNKETEEFLDNYKLFTTRTKEDVPKLSGVVVPDYEAPTTQSTGWDDFYINLGFYMDRFKESWEEIGPVVNKVFSGITDVVSAASAKETRLFENDKKRKETALDDEYQKRKNYIERTIIDEEIKKDAIETLDAEFAAKKDELNEQMANKEKAIKKKQAKRNKAIALMDAIVNTASSIVEALPNLALALATGALGAAQIGIIASTPIPEFKEGGIVSGPTLGIMGEYSNAKSNPEVIAPLDKLKNMIGGDNQKIEVVGRLIGNDIYLSNKKTAFNRLRTT